MKSDPDTEVPNAVSSSAMDVRTNSILEAFGAPHKSPFLWKNCENENQRDRVDIKQQAVFDGLQFGENIATTLINWHKEKKQTRWIPGLTDWIKNYGL